MKNKKNKTYMMQVRFTDDEIQALKQVADSMEITLSDYVRSQVFKPAKVKSLLAEIQKEELK